MILGVGFAQRGTLWSDQGQNQGHPSSNSHLLGVQANRLDPYCFCSVYFYYNYNYYIIIIVIVMICFTLRYQHRS